MVGASEVKDEPCRCIEDGLQSLHQINWNTDVAVVEPGVDECDHQRLKCGCWHGVTNLSQLTLIFWLSKPEVITITDW